MPTEQAEVAGGQHGGKATATDLTSNGVGRLERSEELVPPMTESRFRLPQLLVPLVQGRLVRTAAAAAAAAKEGEIAMPTEQAEVAGGQHGGKATATDLTFFSAKSESNSTSSDTKKKAQAWKCLDDRLFSATTCRVRDTDARSCSCLRGPSRRTCVPD
jgi:hypothetical protein